jgi:hypothetical protein
MRHAVPGRVRPAAGGLATLESRWLGLRRSGDLEGRFIPPTYLQYLRGGTAPISTDSGAQPGRPAESGAPDRRGSALPAAVESGAGDGRRRDSASMADEQLRAARICWQANELQRARALLERCLAAAAAPAVRQAARTLLAQLHKRHGEWDPACRLWEAMAADDPALVDPVEETGQGLRASPARPARALAWVDQRLAGPDLDAAAARSAPAPAGAAGTPSRLGVLPVAPRRSFEGLRAGDLPDGPGIANLRSP